MVPTASEVLESGPVLLLVQYNCPLDGKRERRKAYRQQACSGRHLPRRIRRAFLWWCVWFGLGSYIRFDLVLFVRGRSQVAQ